ncbi:Alkaline phosphatase synthesis transcriptional regulatory protein SphR [Rosistilla oblonga]|uniref:Alkaline phosphatase synthesis transcriptional regulatory protein SphR n=1 Tax=Rosistilla oblonga TaxID=2527990 RepID=A0A518IXL2_9BACT|nr:response regulator transcription factor [Rosistilla oblonga]QDV13989.1 Alkaline phosphatase synthesis transcriptional regulatory protein SphR [Rosistilla oblonga]QDV57818.1 Alkaline phosphatase synthesis transcriptional regulatory protein SphR [Rosistilla oblonga]
MKGSTHILIVEDEEHLGVGIKYNLEQEGYRVTLCADGPTALKLIEQMPESIDLMVLDLMLPGMSGYTVCETVRDWGLTLPILMLSARTLAEDRTRGFDVGANQYLAKPFDLDELLSRVKNLLQLSRPNRTPRKPKPEPVKEVRFATTFVNFETFEVEVDDKPARMTPKELRLLKYFVENEGRVISRQELLTEVWELPGQLQTRAVDQFIVRLRKVFEVDPSNPRHLLTIRDAGYRFVKEPADADDSEE